MLNLMALKERNKIKIKKTPTHACEWHFHSNYLLELQITVLYMYKLLIKTQIYIYIYIIHQWSQVWIHDTSPSKFRPKKKVCILFLTRKKAFLPKKNTWMALKQTVCVATVSTVPTPPQLLKPHRKLIQITKNIFRNNCSGITIKSNSKFKSNIDWSEWLLICYHYLPWQNSHNK